MTDPAARTTSATRSLRRARSVHHTSEEFATMPAMSRFECAFCRGAGWRAFAGRIVLPWALQGERLGGDVLEIGGGGGAMAARLLATSADRASVRQADATQLPFPDDRFDAVLSFIMLHHVIDWEAAVGEAIRVLRPGGVLVGYDLVASRPGRWLHQAKGARHRLMAPRELRDRLADLPTEAVRLRPGLAGLVGRFTARKALG